MPVYLVETPEGERVIEARTQRDAVDHCVLDDYKASTLTPVALSAKVREGVAIEQTRAAAAAIAANDDEGQMDIEEISQEAPEPKPKKEKKKAA